MVLFRRFVCMLLFFTGAANVWAQTKSGTYKTPPIPSEVKVIYTKESSFGAFIHSNGYGISYKRSKLSERSGFKKIALNADFLTMRHPKEIRIAKDFYENARSFVFGKKNALLLLRTGIGTDNVLFDRADKDGVEIGYNIEGGLSLGLLKPVYLDVFVQGEQQGFVVVSEKYDHDKHQIEDIYGGSGFFTGFGETKVLPGGYGKFSFSFDWAKDETKILCLEAGASIDIFPKKVPIFAVFGNDVNKQSYITFFAKIAIGSRKL